MIVQPHRLCEWETFPRLHSEDAVALFSLSMLPSLKKANAHLPTLSPLDGDIFNNVSAFTAVVLLYYIYVCKYTYLFIYCICVCPRTLHMHLYRSLQSPEESIRSPGGVTSDIGAVNQIQVSGRA